VLQGGRAFAVALGEQQVAADAAQHPQAPDDVGGVGGEAADHLPVVGLASLEPAQERPGDDGGDGAPGDDHRAEQRVDRPDQGRADDEHREVVAEEPDVGDRAGRPAGVLAGEVHQLPGGDPPAHPRPGGVEVVGEAADERALVGGLGAHELAETQRPEDRLGDHGGGGEREPERQRAAVAGDEPLVDDPADHPQLRHRRRARQEVQQDAEGDAARVGPREADEQAPRRRRGSGRHGSEAYLPTGIDGTAEIGRRAPPAPIRAKRVCAERRRAFTSSNIDSNDVVEGVVMPYVASRHNSWIVHILAIIFGFIALIILLHLAFVLLEANPHNPLVNFIGDLANWFSWLFRDMFRVDDPKVRAIVNYGLAALVYLAIAGAIASVGRSRWSRHG
jgi:hypothetical protein